MPIPLQRPIETFRSVMQGWLARLLNLANVVVSNETQPVGVGNANETIIFKATWRDEANILDKEFVVRVAPTGFRVMLEPRFMETMRLQQWLANHTDLPVPKLLGYEEDPRLLGAPFYVMERVIGRVPTDNPSYSSPQSWVAKLTAPQRKRLWRSAIEALAAIHRRDLSQETSLPIERPGAGLSGLDMEVDYWNRFHQWAGGGLAHPISMIAHDWLKANMPTTRTALGWGDARLENMMFDDEMRCVAVLDWEMANMAGPLPDLGWWLFMSRVSYESAGRTEPLSGLGTREQTLKLWTDLTGISADGIDWFEVFAAYRMISFLDRFIHLAEQASGSIPGVSRLDNFALRATHRLLNLKDYGKYTSLVKWPST